MPFRQAQGRLSRLPARCRRYIFAALRADNDLQGLRGLKALAEDAVAGGDLGDGVDVNDVIAVSHHVSEGNGHVGVAGLEFEVLVADGRGALVCNRDCDDDDGKIEGFF